MTDLTPSIEQNHLGNYRILRGGFPVAMIVLMSDGSGWRVRPLTASRKGQRKSWLSPRQAFKTYYRTEAWAKSLAGQLPNQDYRTGRDL